MLDLHANVAAEQGGEVLRVLDTMDGVRHATALPASADGTVHVMAEVGEGVAEKVWKPSKL
jgi:hypothetical protein